MFRPYNSYEQNLQIFWTLAEVDFRGLTQQRYCKTTPQLLTKDQYGLKKILRYSSVSIFSERRGCFGPQKASKWPRTDASPGGMTMKLSFCWWCYVLSAAPWRCFREQTECHLLGSAPFLFLLPPLNLFLSLSVPNRSSEVCSHRVYVMRPFIMFHKHKDI